MTEIRAGSPPGPSDLVEAWRRQWGSSWSPRDYGALLGRAARAAFARRTTIAEVRDGRELLGGGRLYALDAVVAGRPVRALGIGSLLTLRAHRRKGHARRLVRWMHRRAAAEGARLALLHSDITPAYYERLGYRTLPHDRWGAALSAFGVAGSIATVSKAAALSRALLAWRAAVRGRDAGLRADARWLAFRTIWIDAYHRTGAGARGHPWYICGRDGSVLLSRRQGRDMELLLWGGPGDSVRGLVAAARDAVVGAPGRVYWQGPGARDLAAAVRGARRTTVRSYMARSLSPSVRLPREGSWEPFAIEGF